MSDLISRSALIENIKDTIGNDARVITIANAFVNIVQQQPIAYDLDAVVEELKNMSGFQYDCSYGRGCEFDDFIHTPKAIDIVRKGGTE